MCHNHEKKCFIPSKNNEHFCFLSDITSGEFTVKLSGNYF